MVFADPDQLQQALINLVWNAAEASLGPDCENRERAQVEVGWKRAGDDLTITITDNGVGLTNESNIFVPFYTTKPSGTGIGLVLAQQIAEAHGGLVKLYNRKDGVAGCVAELRLPVISKMKPGTAPLAMAGETRRT